MTTFVDDMRAGFVAHNGARRYTMCHMIADSHAELIAMADKIGVLRKWIQHEGTAREHFDIAMTKRALAVAAGAVEIEWRQAGAMTKRRQIEGTLGIPEDAVDWLWAYRLATSKPPQGRDGEEAPTAA